MSRFEFFIGGAEAGRTGGWVVLAVGVAVGDGGIGGGVGGKSATCCWLVLAFGFFAVGFGVGCFLGWPGCAMELPSALKKSPSDPASARWAASRAAINATTTVLGNLFTDGA